MSREAASTLVKPVAVGLIAAVGCGLVGGFSNSISVFGVNVPHFLAVGGIVGASSAVTEVTKNYIVPRITSDPTSKVATLAIQPGITGLSVVGLSLLLNGKGAKDAIVSSFILGAGAQIGGSYAVDAVVRSYIKR